MKVLKENESELVDLITDKQLFQKGIDGEGKFLFDLVPYTPFTQQIKRAKNQPSNRVTLKDEGDFHRSFFLRTEKFPVKADARDSKRDELAFKYGEEIFDFAEETIPDVNNQIESDVIQMMQNGIERALSHL